jgi:hypothetical protein
MRSVNPGTAQALIAIELAGERSLQIREPVATSGGAVKPLTRSQKLEEFRRFS